MLTNLTANMSIVTLVLIIIIGIWTFIKVVRDADDKKEITVSSLFKKFKNFILNSSKEDEDIDKTEYASEDEKLLDEIKKIKEKRNLESRYDTNHSDKSEDAEILENSKEKTPEKRYKIK